MDVLGQIMKQFNIDPAKAQEAWAIAKEMGAGVKTKQQAMKLLAEKGIDRNALVRIGEYLDHPAAAGLAKFTGVNLPAIKRDFNSLLGETSSGASITPVNNGSDPLAKYRKGYKQL